MEQDIVEEESADTLGINKLIIDYDYLLYRINDYVQSIQYKTELVCKSQNHLINDEIIEGQIDTNIEHFKEILKQCEELENHFDMMDQIDMIVKMFNERLHSITKDYNELKTNGHANHRH